MSTDRDHEGVAAVVKAIESAIATDEFSLIGAHFADSITWGDCSGKADAHSFLEQAAAVAPPIAGGSVTEIDDRLVVSIRFDEVAGGSGRQEIHSAVFVEAGRIVEIIDAVDAEHAANARPIGPLPEAASRPARIASLAPVLPVADITAAADHYRKLGFDVEAYEGPAAYAFVSRDDVQLHLAQVSELDPKRSMSAVYLYVDDADALYAAWRRAELAGRFVAPTDTDYGLREGAHVDPDGNLLRFGSDLPK